MIESVKTYVKTMKHRRRVKFWQRMSFRVFWMLVGAGVISLFNN